MNIRIVIKKILSTPISLLDSIANAYMAVLLTVMRGYVPFWLDIQSKRIAARTSSVTHETGGKHHHFIFHTPNALCQWRVNTFSSKEPETLEWIDQYGGDGVLFDIGANIGLYSVYYGKTKPGLVYAFEPSVFNLGLLAKNINVNGLQDKIRIITNPLTMRNEFANFNLQVTDEGGALSAFGVDHGQDGKPLQKVFSYQTCGFTLDFLIAQGIINQIPRMIKIDVDGIEHLILRGARETLSSPQCITVLIEAHKDFKTLVLEVANTLTECGFEKSTGESVNQIWIKR